MCKVFWVEELNGSLHGYLDGKPLGVAILPNADGSAFLSSVNEAIRSAKFKSVENAKAKVERVLGGA